ncbi:hypothetical protein BN135_1132 [Cronobacter muytjensii 530]
MGAERAGALVAKTQPGHLLHQARDFRHHHVIHGRGADQHAFGAKDVGKDFVFIAAGDVKDFHRHARIHFRNALGDSVRHQAGIVRHGVVENRDAIFLIIRRPFEVQLDNLRRVVAPDHAVRSGNHLHRQVKAEDLGDFRRHQAAERRQDIGVVAQALLEQLGLVHFIVKEMLVAVMLAEGVVAEQYRVAGQVSHHAVRPVQHRGLDEDQLFAVADIQRIAGFHHVKVPLRVMVMPVYGIDTVRGAVNRRIRDAVHQLGERARVILFGVVDNDVVDIRKIDFAAQVIDKIAAEFVVDGVDQHIFLFADKIAVVTAAF